MSKKEFLSHPELIKKIDAPHTELTLFNSSDIIHKLSHRELHVKFWILHTSDHPKQGVLWTEVSKVAVPIVIDRFIREFLS